MVINQKMMKVIVSGIPQSVRLGVAMIEDVITFGRSAEHGGGGLGGAAPPNFLDFPGVSSFGGTVLMVAVMLFVLRVLVVAVVMLSRIESCCACW